VGASLPEQAEQAKAWLRQAMLDGLAPLIAPVPVEVEVSAGRTWAGDEIVPSPANAASTPGVELEGGEI
jgi:hypothetical protein